MCSQSTETLHVLELRHVYRIHMQQNTLASSLVKKTLQVLVDTKLNASPQRVSV